MPLTQVHRRPRPWFALAATALLALALAGCVGSLRGPREWNASAELVAGGTFVISVRDTSGRIDDVEIDPAGVAVPDEITNPAGQPNVVLVPWVGGACDQRTDIPIEARGGGIALTVHTTVAPGPCDAMGVLHVLRLTSLDALPAAAVTISNWPAAGG
jgi:hypothetical protein